MVQIIIFLLFINKILCESIYKKTAGTGSSNYKAELQFENDFKTIKSWTLSSGNIGSYLTVCYVNKNEQKIECFGSVDQFITPYYILEAINQWYANTFPRSVDGYQPDIEFEQEIGKTVIKTIRSVINTFTTDSCASSDPNTGAIQTVCYTRYKFNDCAYQTHESKTSITPFDTTQLKTDRFPQFALERDSFSIVSIHEPQRDFQSNDFKLFYGYLLFEVSGNRDAFWCAVSPNIREDCNEAEFRERFNCFLSGIRAEAVRTNADIKTPSYNNSIPPSTGPNIVETWNHSTGFKVEDLFGLGIFLLLFVIPIISLCVFNLIPEKVDHTPLEPTKFAEITKIRELVRKAEQIEDAEKL